MWECPWCEEEIEVKEWEDVICPKCKEELEWDEDCYSEEECYPISYLEYYTILQRKE